MRKFVLCLFFLQFAVAGKLFSQTNMPNGATAPASATPVKLPDNGNPFTAPLFYVRTYSPVKPVTDSSQISLASPMTDVLTGTDFMDASGRSIQTVYHQISAS